MGFYAQTLEIFDTPILARRHRFRPLSRSFRPTFPKRTLGECSPMAREPRIPVVRARRLSRTGPFSGKFGVKTHLARSKTGLEGEIKNFEGLGLQPPLPAACPRAAARAGRAEEMAASRFRGRTPFWALANERTTAAPADRGRVLFLNAAVPCRRATLWWANQGIAPCPSLRRHRRRPPRATKIPSGE